MCAGNLITSNMLDESTSPFVLDAHCKHGLHHEILLRLCNDAASHVAERIDRVTDLKRSALTLHHAATTLSHATAWTRLARSVGECAIEWHVIGVGHLDVISLFIREDASLMSIVNQLVVPYAQHVSWLFVFPLV